MSSLMIYFVKRRRKSPTFLVALLRTIPNAAAELLSNSGCFSMLKLQCNFYTLLHGRLASMPLSDACVRSKDSLSPSTSPYRSLWWRMGYSWFSTSRLHLAGCSKVGSLSSCSAHALCPIVIAHSEGFEVQNGWAHLCVVVVMLKIAVAMLCTLTCIAGPAFFVSISLVHSLWTRPPHFTTSS